VLEERIATADERARKFQSSDPAAHPDFMFRSRLACTACHAK
jgi:predicted Zn-dependent protease